MTISEGSGKGARDENFPVASVLIAPRHRPAVMAFYTVARMADDVADNPALSAEDKLRQLALIEASLTGADDAVAEAAHLRRVLAARDLSDIHIRELLEAFRRDAVQSRYADWDELMDYCRYSAAPVGRFMLDVHGEPRSAWPASDALCAALQVINHLQDCAEDYREIDRVYVPLDALSSAGLDVSALGEARASPALRGVIAALARRTGGLLETSRRLGPGVADLRFSMDIGVIQAIAERLARRLMVCDPLSERVHLSPVEALGSALAGVGAVIGARVSGRQSGLAAA
jgi:squalene synthase HpnC